MGRSMAQFVGSYNNQKNELAETHRRVVEAKMVKQAEHKAFITRKAEIEELVATMFWRVPRHLQRGVATMNKAYNTADQLAHLGGEEYRAAITALKFATAVRNPETYADACAVCLIEVNGR